MTSGGFIKTRTFRTQGTRAVRRRAARFEDGFGKSLYSRGTIGVSQPDVSTKTVKLDTILLREVRL